MLFKVSGTHWGSWNVSPRIRGDDCVTLELGSEMPVKEPRSGVRSEVRAGAMTSQPSDCRAC